MLIFGTKGKITVDKNKTNIAHYFDVPENIGTLTVNFRYFPKTIEDEKAALYEIKNCLEKYGANCENTDEKRLKEFLPVKNLVTISIDENGKYRGAAHRQNNEQRHILSSDFASPGFVKGKIESGKWDIVLNVHSVSCTVDYEITVSGEVE